MFYFRFYFAKIRKWNGKSRWSRNGIKLLFLILKRVPLALQDIEKIPFEWLRSIRDWSIYCKWSLNNEQQNHWLNNNNYPSMEYSLRNQNVYIAHSVTNAKFHNFCHSIMSVKLCSLSNQTTEKGQHSTLHATITCSAVVSKCDVSEPHSAIKKCTFVSL